MPYIEKAIAASSDDCAAYWSGSAWNALALTGTHSPRIGYSTGIAFKFGSGLRWTGYQALQHKRIISAKVRIYGRDYSLTTVNAVITGDKELDPATWSTIANYQSRRGTIVGGANDNYITTAQVSWNDIPAWANATVYDTPDISSIITEIISQPNWNSGTIALWIDDHAGTSTAYRGGYSYDSGVTPYNRLYVRYEFNALLTRKILVAGGF